MSLSRAINALAHPLATLVTQLAPRLLAERGCGVLTAAKLIGEIGGISRFASDGEAVTYKAWIAHDKRRWDHGAACAVFGSHLPPRS